MGHEMYVWPSVGVRIRSEPNTKARQLKTAAFAQKLRILEEVGERIELEGKPGKWVRVQTEKGAIGFAFNYYLSAHEHKALINGCKNLLFAGELPNDMKGNFEIKDIAHGYVVLRPPSTPDDAIGESIFRLHDNGAIAKQFAVSKGDVRTEILYLQMNDDVFFLIQGGCCGYWDMGLYRPGKNSELEEFFSHSSNNGQVDIEKGRCENFSISENVEENGKTDTIIIAKYDCKTKQIVDLRKE